MKLEVDREADAAYVTLVDAIAPGQASRQVRVPLDFAAGEVVLDFDHAGRLLGVEVLGAGSLLPEELLQQASQPPGGSAGG